MRIEQRLSKVNHPRITALLAGLLVFSSAQAATLPAEDTFATHGLGGFEKSVRDMNDQGVTVGKSAVNTSGDTFSHAVMWDEAGQLIDLDPGRDRDSIAMGINNNNDAVGKVFGVGPVLFSQGNITNLRDQKKKVNASARAEDINDNGLIVGCAKDQPVQWNNSTNAKVVPGTPRRTTGCAITANNSGDIVGNAVISGKGNQRAVLWRDGNMIDLGVLPGHESSSAIGINELGQVVGSSTDLDGSNGNETHPFLWDNGVMIDLGMLTGNNGSAADINDAGEIVGSAPGPFWWRNGVMYDLSPIDPLMSNAVAINASGQIAGTSRVLTPAPGQLDLALTMSGPTYDIPSGEEFDINLTVTNLSAADGDNVIVTDYLAGEFMLVSVSSSQGVCSISNPTGNPIPRDATPIACELGTVAAQSSVAITISAKADIPFSNTPTVRFLFDSAFITAAADVNSANNLDVVNLRVIPPPAPEGADIAVTHSATPNPVKIRQELTFNTNVVNNGPGTAVNSSLRVSLSISHTFVSVNTTRGSCSRNGPYVDCIFGDLAAADNADVEIKIKPKATGTYFSGAIITSDTHDPVISNNNRAISVTVVR
jgi:probable HAF family extracellular repeat protein